MIKSIKLALLPLLFVVMSPFASAGTLFDGPFALNLEGGGVVSTGFKSQRMYAQGTLDWNINKNWTVGAGILHVNNLDSATFAIEDWHFDNDSYDGNSIRLNNAGDLNNENNPVVYGRYRRQMFYPGLHGEGTAKYVDDIKSVEVMLGVSYDLTDDIVVGAGYTRTRTLDDNHEIEGLAMFIRTNL